MQVLQCAEPKECPRVHAPASTSSGASLPASSATELESPPLSEEEEGAAGELVELQATTMRSALAANAMGVPRRSVASRFTSSRYQNGGIEEHQQLWPYGSQRW